jgi:outer membrane lipoprotein SlyB
MSSVLGDFMKTNIFTLAISALLLAGCANTGANYRPIIDSKNVDLNRYEADLVECQHYAEQKGGAGEKAAIGAGAGAVLGGVLAAVGNGDKGSASRVGGVMGAVSGATSGDQSQRNIIKRCLVGRGYKVLD